MTFEQIIEAFNTNHWLHYGDCLTRNKMERWRRSGKLISYKRTPERDYIPIKYGMHTHGRINRSDTDLDQWHIDVECPLLTGVKK